MLLGPRGSTGDSLILQIVSGGVLQSRDLKLSRNTLCMLSPGFWFFIVLFVITGRYSSVGSDVTWESRSTAIDPSAWHIFS